MYHIVGHLGWLYKLNPHPRHQHCTDEAQKAETVLSAVIYIYIYYFLFSVHIVMMPNRQIFGIESYAFFIITVFTRVSAALLFKRFTSKYGTVRWGTPGR